MYKIDTNTFYSSFYKIKKRKKKNILTGYRVSVIDNYQWLS